MVVEAFSLAWTRHLASLQQRLVQKNVCSCAYHAAPFSNWSITRRNDTFTNAQIDALRTYASHVRPGTIRLLQSLNPIVRTIIFGRIPGELFKALQSNGSPFFGDSELSCANNDDEAALASQNPDIPWMNAVPQNEDHEDAWKILYNRVEEHS